ncbi:coat protein [Sugarcane striate mosaic-associated virus]|uniref:Capsid protein n=1 Tax=Sugarcane striate mosaic-associated virus TaxID=167927 RepID=Q91BP3_9VIRU|nr:coat protein [Sugarcane striate mosaic-associated virus]AAL05448.1 coat protein [Sugarcane striate mosaic-associated virus]
MSGPPPSTGANASSGAQPTTQQETSTVFKKSRRGSKSKFVSAVTKEQVRRVVELDIETDKIARDEDLEKVKAAWLAINVPSDKIFEVSLEITLSCAHTSTSNKQKFKGKSKFCDILLAEIAGCITKEEVTIRSFCAYWAKYVWNAMHERNEPPLNWVALGYTEQNRFAAFDFFYGVDSPASAEPEGGLLAPTTESMRAANMARKEIAIKE